LELSQLIALQKADLKLRSIKSELDAIPQRRAEIENEFDQRAFEVRAVETRRDDARAARVRLENEIAETKAKSERAERNLMASQNQKDYEAAIRENDAARKHVAQLETQVLEQMEVFEQSEKELQEREPEVAKLREEMGEKLAAFEERTSTQTADLAAARAEREHLLQTLPKQVSSLYNRISSRIRDGIAVAEARNNSCTACHISLRPAVMAKVRRGEEIILCDNCSRILYYAPQEQAQSAPVAVS
jgi:predicted  nucleic acid-binding Zn-ribbon protein